MQGNSSECIARNFFVSENSKAWECVWHKLIIEKKGGKTFADKNINLTDYSISFEILNEMWHQVDRLITKYENETDPIAVDLVDILRGHRDALGVDTPIDPLTYDELMSYHLE